jgi:hypothetical protein
VSGYPIPISLQSNTPSLTAPEPENTNVDTTPVNYDPNRDTIIKGDVFNRNSYGTPTNSGTITPSTGTVNTGGDFELPPEQSIN